MRNATAFSLAFMVQRAIGFLTLPLYTRALSPAEYGVVGLLAAVSAGATILFTLGLDQALFRTYFQLEDQPERLRRFLGTAWRFTLVFPLLAAVTVAGVASLFIANAPFSSIELLLALIGAAVGVGCTAVPGTMLRAAERVRDYVILTLVTAFVAPTAGISLVVVADLGVSGFLVGIIAANVATLAAAFLLVPWDRTVTTERSELVKSLKLGLPLVPHFLSHWALQIADRLLLAGLVTSAVLGYYSLAANIAIPFLVAASSLNQGFMPTYARAGKGAANRDELREAVVLQVTVLATIILAGTLLGPPLVRFLAPPDYHDAAALIPWLVLGYGFLGLYYVPMNVASLTMGRTRGVWVATAFSAGVNLALVAVLVPSQGVIAAAQASAVGYLVLLVLVTIYAHAKPHPLTYDVRRLVPVLALAGLAYGLGATIDIASPSFELIARGLVWIAFLVFLLLTGLMPLPKRFQIGPLRK